MSTSNLRIKSVQPISPPNDLLSELPVNIEIEKLVDSTRVAIGNILHKRESRLLVVIGPCSIHDTEAAIDYAQRLMPLRSELSEQLEIVMRVYFEKPRSTIGWKGLINDPDLNNSYNVDKGLKMARRLLLALNQIGMPAACEFLDAVTGQYYADLVSWGAIGARTTESQVHRELASGLSCPVGFKNGTNGNLTIALDAVIAASNEHIFLSPTEAGQTALFTTTGNIDSHIILRGGIKPNYDAKNVALAINQLKERKIETGIMIDCSHANSQKQYQRQTQVAEDIARQIERGSNAIVACMIESHLVAGQQPVGLPENLVYGQSITDACLGFAESEDLLRRLATAVKQRHQINI